MEISHGASARTPRPTHPLLSQLSMENTFGQSPQSSIPDLADGSSLIGTPTSVSASSHSQGAYPNLQQQGLSNFPELSGSRMYMDSNLIAPVTDISAMMFPSTDPFAYPNQAMTMFENNSNIPYQDQFADSKHFSPPFARVVGMSPGTDSPRSSMYNVHGPGTPISALGTPAPHMPSPDLAVQIFGPTPMYMAGGPEASGSNLGAEFKHPRDHVTSARQHQGGGYPTSSQAGNPQSLQQSSDTNMEDILGGKDWTAAFVDQGLGFGGGTFDTWGSR